MGCRLAAALAIASSTSWALLFAATTTHGSAHGSRSGKSRFLVNGWSLPPRRFRRDGLPSAQTQLMFASSSTNNMNNDNDDDGPSRKNTRGLPHLRRALEMRGGADDDIDIEKENDDEDDIIMASDSGDEDGSDDGQNNAMRELRKKWSDTPAVPSISSPVTTDATAMDDPFAETTLGDFDDSDIILSRPTITSTTAIQQQQQQRQQQQQQSNAKTEKAIIIMDGFCPFHGQYLSHAARHAYGASVIHVLSDFMVRYLYQVEGRTDHLSSRMPDLDKGEDVEAWSSALRKGVEICGVYCESDSGLEDAERLGVALGLYPRCHDGVNAARRDKFLMNRAVAEAGLDAVQQKACGTLEEAESFAKGLGLGEETEGGKLVVVKPPRGVASDDVHLCSDLPSLRKAFTKILHSPIFGSSAAAEHEHVLLQEFAAGVEYAVDVVCRDGERKASAAWRYDKRAVNGAPFVYFATELVSVDDAEGAEKEVCDYVFKALDALGVRWGLSHVEVIAETSPETGEVRVRLVEVNCRQHNTDFMPLTNACVGYNALDLVLAAHLGDSDDDNENARDNQGLQWDDVPVMPTTRAYGAIVHFVSHVEGTISCINYNVLDEVNSLPSVMDMHVYPQFLEVGNEIRKTVDIRSDTGWAHLMNDDEDEFQRDYERLVELMEKMFEVE